ncbi:MAG TPA: hypothetical protein VMW68_00135 [Methyloceanibacter sp.]|nr:hypothetical protein [Methyloceanibacter sp.]
MSDSLSWIDNSDHKRIKGIVYRSTDVIAAARRDLERHWMAVERSPTGEGVTHPSRHVDRAASAQRRALFRQLLHSPEMRDALPPKRPPRAALTESTAERNAAQSSKASRRPTLHDTRVETWRRAEPREAPKTALRDSKEKTQEGRRRAVSTMPPRWALRLDYLMNVVTGIFAAFVIWSVFSASLGTSAGPMPLVANPEIDGKQQTRLQDRQSSPQPPEGFNVLASAFPKPLPKMAEDVATLLVLTQPSVAAAPGVVVLPYPDMPEILREFPEDVRALMTIATPERPASAPWIR